MSENEKKGILQKWKDKQKEKKKKVLIEKIKKKDEKINKDKEEIKKMALELKGGKLVKKEEQKRGAPPEPRAQPQQQPMQQPQQQPMQQPQPVQVPQQPQPQMMPSGAAVPYTQPMPEAGPNPFDAAAQQQEVPQQQFANQPTGPAEMPQEDAMKDVPINFVLVGGMSFHFITKLGSLKDVLTYIAESINNQEVIELGNRLINPRHILFYEY